MLTQAEEEAIVARYLETVAGKAHFRRVLLAGWPNMALALMEHYIPMLIRRAKRLVPGKS